MHISPLSRFDSTCCFVVNEIKQGRLVLMLDRITTMALDTSSEADKQEVKDFMKRTIEHCVQEDLAEVGKTIDVLMNAYKIAGLI